MTRAAAAFLAYAAATLAVFHRLLPDLAGSLYSDLGDPLLNATILAWNARHRPLSDAWWNFPSFAPLSGVTAFTEHLLATYPLASPVIWLTGNPVLAHNVVLLATFPLNGLAMYLLARELTGSPAAAFLGGLAYAFAPYQSVHLSHVQTLTAWGMPLALLGLHRSLRCGTADARSLALFGGGWLVTALSNAYMMVFFPMLVALWCLWFIRPGEWRRLLRILAVALLVVAAMAPLLLGYHERLTAYGFARTPGEIQSFAADVTGILGISHRQWLWRGWLPHTFEESALFPGIAAAALALLAVIGGRGGAATDGGRTSRRALWGAAVLTLIALARIWTGPFGWRLGPIPLPPFSPSWPLTAAVALAAAGIALAPRVRAGCRRRDVITFYALSVALLWWFALGPYPEWSPSRLRALVYGPYALLMQLPGYSTVRVPARLWLPATLCISVLVAFGSARLLRAAATSGRRVGRRTVVVAVAACLLAEGWWIEGRAAVPPPMPAGVIPADALVLDLPIDEGFWNALPQYRAVLGGYRTLNGYSGYEPPHFNQMRHAIADRREDALAPFLALRELYVIVRPGSDARVVRWLRDHPGAEVTFVASGIEVIRLPRPHPAAPQPPLPLPLPNGRARPFGVR